MNPTTVTAQPDVTAMIWAVLSWALTHTGDIAMLMALLGLLRVEGGKLADAFKAKNWQVVDQVLIEMMTQASAMVMSNPEKRAWVLRQTMQVAQHTGLDKRLQLKDPEDLATRLETLWNTVVQPQVKAQPTLDATVTPTPEGAPNVSVGVNAGPISFELPLKLPF